MASLRWSVVVDRAGVEARPDGAPNRSVTCLNGRCAVADRRLSTTSPRLSADWRALTLEERKNRTNPRRVARTLDPPARSICARRCERKNSVQLDSAAHLNSSLRGWFIRQRPPVHQPGIMHSCITRDSARQRISSSGVHQPGIMHPCITLGARQSCDQRRAAASAPAESRARAAISGAYPSRKLGYAKLNPVALSNAEQQRLFATTRPAPGRASRRPGAGAGSSPTPGALSGREPEASAPTAPSSASSHSTTSR